MCLCFAQTVFESCEAGHNLSENIQAVLSLVQSDNMSMKGTLNQTVLSLFGGSRIGILSLEMVVIKVVKKIELIQGQEFS